MVQKYIVTYGDSGVIGFCPEADFTHIADAKAYIRQQAISEDDFNNYRIWMISPRSKGNYRPMPNPQWKTYNDEKERMLDWIEKHAQ